MTAPKDWDCRRCDLRFEVLAIGTRRPRQLQACPNCGHATRRVGAIRPARGSRRPAESTENALGALDWQRRRAAENLN